jgi:hypothetical protein
VSPTTIPRDLTDRVIALDDERYDELLYTYPTPGEATRAEMPEVRLRSHGDHFRAIILGYGTSYEEAHRHVPGGRPEPGDRCSGCRWTDVTIMWAQPYDDEGPTATWQYAVVVRGRSVLPGEDQRIRTTWTPDPAMVLDALYVPVPKKLRITGRERSIVGPHEDALLDAALLDEPLAKIAEGYERVREGDR